MHSIHYYFFSLTRTRIGRVSIVPGFLFSFLFFWLQASKKTHAGSFDKLQSCFLLAAEPSLVLILRNKPSMLLLIVIRSIFGSVCIKFFTNTHCCWVYGRIARENRQKSRFVNWSRGLSNGNGTVFYKSRVVKHSVYNIL